MSTDRKYSFPLTRNKGYRRKAGASSPAKNEEMIICSSNQSDCKVSVVSQAISGALPQSNGREQQKTETKDSTDKSSNKPCGKSEKPNCYKCKYQGEIPGNAHSICLHPNINKHPLEPFLAALSLMGGRAFRQSGINLGYEKNKLGVTGNEHGIESGWFNWPFNFDPIWLETCDGFEAK